MLARVLWDRGALDRARTLSRLHEVQAWVREHDAGRPDPAIDPELSEAAELR